MIFNLMQYITTELPAIPITVNGFPNDERLDIIALNETGGTVEHQYPRTDFTVQVIGKFNQVLTGKEQMGQVFDLLKNRFGLTLPAVTVNGVTYPQITAWQISPVQAVSYLGLNSESMALLSFNIVVTIQEGITCP